MAPCTFRWIADDHIVIEADLIIVPEHAWPAMAESDDPEWSTLVIDGEVRALRLRGVPSVATGVPTDSAEFSILPSR